MDQKVQEIEITMEIGSEAPHVNEKWPSAITSRISYSGCITNKAGNGVTV
ncbi:hypothetical protein JI735_22325 [Paenibacillus sonchi]|uniref:Uncharacterized protein n=1 Tax=Paenibacillus sonchi TaxID=373687 RepID=A0A974SBJ6_9BACL|nr:hypothetical protein [Paenibacillus sonchi]QQZ59379.1 hypothetical protein JI735_22325 [Paenibacillus sonchi]